MSVLITEEMRYKPNIESVTWDINTTDKETKISNKDILKINRKFNLNINFEYYNLNETIIGPNWFILTPKYNTIKNYENKLKRHSEEEKICLLCNSKFYGSKFHQSTCRCCKLIINCPNCKKWFEKNLNGRILNNIDLIINNKKLNICCTSSCRTSLNNKSIIYKKCNICNNNYQSSGHNSKICKNCKEKIIFKLKHTCSECGTFDANLNRDQNGRGIECGCSFKKLKEIGLRNIKYIHNIDFDELYNENIIFNNQKIDFSKLQAKQCGTWLLKGKFKENNKTYNLILGKSNDIYSEIRWVLRVLSQPEKQDKIISETNHWTLAKWWYIANLYYDFEFILLTNISGVSEEEALLVEAKYAIDNNMICDKDQIIRDGYSKNHSYWNF